MSNTATQDNAKLINEKNMWAESQIMMERLFCKSGGMLIMLGGLAFTMLVVYSFYKKLYSNLPQATTEGGFWNSVDAHAGELIILVGIIILISAGVGLLSMAYRRNESVVPGRDRDTVLGLVKSGNSGGVTEYIRVAGLSGAAGLATKFQINGLVLVMFILTIMFSIASIILMFSVTADKNIFKDLVQLTVGALIAAFSRSTSTSMGGGVASAPAPAVVSGGDSSGNPVVSGTDQLDGANSGSKKTEHASSPGA